MTRASGTTRGSAVSSPGTSFQSETRDGAERAGEQGGGEVGAAAAERRHLAVGRGADEAGDDRDDAAGEQRREGALGAAVGAREVGRGLAERAVGVDEVEGIHILCLRPVASSAAATRRALSRSPREAR